MSAVNDPVDAQEFTGWEQALIREFSRLDAETESVDCSASSYITSIESKSS